jgi:hypothetical protein
MKNLVAFVELLRLTFKLLELRSLKFIGNQKLNFICYIEKSSILILFINVYNNYDILEYFKKTLNSLILGIFIHFQFSIGIISALFIRLGF